MGASHLRIVPLQSKFTQLTAKKVLVCAEMLCSPQCSRMLRDSARSSAHAANNAISLKVILFKKRMSSAVDRIRLCVNRHVKVDLDDGRVVFGRLRCSDQQNNIVLTEAVEQRAMRDVAGAEIQVLFRTNLVLIPSAHVVRFCVDHVHDGSVDVTAPPRVAVTAAATAAAAVPAPSV